MARELFDRKGKGVVYIEKDGIGACLCSETYPTNSVNCTSQKQAKKLLAINKLLNVAKFLNKDWKPDWENNEEPRWYLCDFPRKRPIPCFTVQNNSCIVYFRTEELAKQAIEILGEDTVRLASTTDW